MEFDKSKVYTAANADELKIGSKVIVDNTFKGLKECVESNYEAVTLQDIRDDDEPYRFSVDSAVYALAYLVEEPAKLNWTDLKIGDIICCGILTAMVTAINSEGNGEFHIFAGDVWLTDKELEAWGKVEHENNN